MRKYLLTIVFLCVFFVDCESAKTKENLENQFEKLNGAWELDYISGSRAVFDELVSSKVPTINFITKENLFFGNNSCNSYSGKLNVNGNKISFKQPMAVTRMMCGNGNAENTYMKTLQEVNLFSVSEDGKILKFKNGKTVIMRFEKK